MSLIVAGCDVEKAFDSFGHQLLASALEEQTGDLVLAAGSLQGTMLQRATVERALQRAGGGLATVPQGSSSS